ncbi:MAG TPA: hypothetical protein VFJ47_13520, partial [Terriglobales bacterium]|nr:hypothetical protein [Terriglobales bacterium]
MSNLAPYGTILRTAKKRRWYFGLAVLLLVLSQVVLAQVAANPSPGGNETTASAGAQNDRLAHLEQQVEDAKSSADNAWML